MINSSVGSIDFVKVLPDGNMLVGCNKKEQASKALKLQEMGGMKVVSTSRAGEAGVISALPLTLAWRRLKVI